jgi:hypothetical protein
MNPIFVSELPVHFHESELYKSFMEYPDEATEIMHSRPLKLDLEFRDLKDVLQILDTCNYLGCSIPWKVYDFAYGKVSLFESMTIFENLANKNTGSKNEYQYMEYQYFINIPEYKSIKLCAKFVDITKPVEFIIYAIRMNSITLIHYFNHFSPFYFSNIRKHDNIANTIVLRTVECGNIEIMEYFRQFRWFDTINKTFRKKMLETATIHDRLDMLKYLHETLMIEWDSIVVDTALPCESLSCLKYAISNGCPISEDSIELAVINCSLEYVKIIVETGAPIDSHNTLFACERGKLEILKYLHEKNAPWHSKSVEFATQNNHMNCVKFAIECGAPCG